MIYTCILSRAHRWIIIVVVRPTEYIIYVYNNNLYYNNTIAAVLISSKIALEIQYGLPDCPLAQGSCCSSSVVVGRLSKIKMPMSRAYCIYALTFNVYFFICMDCGLRFNIIYFVTTQPATGVYSVTSRRRVFFCIGNIIIIRINRRLQREKSVLSLFLFLM